MIERAVLAPDRPYVIEHRCAQLVCVPEGDSPDRLRACARALRRMGGGVIEVKP